VLERVKRVSLKLNEPIDMKLFANTIERAQATVEGRNFQSRKHVLQYDDVMNKQREVIYGQRQKVLNGEDLRETIVKMIDSAIDGLVDLHCSGEFPDYWNMEALEAEATTIYSRHPIHFPKEEYNYLTKDKIKDEIKEAAEEKYAFQEERFGEHLREIERMILLEVVDLKWVDHIDDMDQLRHGISLRSYGQHDPVVEYQNVGYEMFEEMIASIGRETAAFVLNVALEEQVERKPKNVQLTEGFSDGAPAKKTVVRKSPKIGRNDPCPCGSGKKYKKCCGFNENGAE